MKFRPVRGGLAESMMYVEEWKTRAELEAIVNKTIGDCYPLVNRTSDPHGTKMQIKWYARDDRIGWNTFIVLVDGIGPVGFTDGEPDPWEDYRI